MSYSFPLSTPSNGMHPSSVVWRENNTVAVSVSPFTGMQQVLEYEADLWAIEVSLPVMNREQAAPWIAFLSKLRGQRGTFYFGDSETAIAQGTPTGTPLVNGAHYSLGYEIVSDGWSNSTLVLKAGDRIQIGNSLYRVLADVTSSGAGAATIDVWPSVRGHANNEAIVVASAKGLFRLTDSSIEESIGSARLWSIGFSAIEVR